MKKVFLDTNFIIDYFIREDYTGEAENVMTLGIANGLEFHISYLTVANFAYIMRKLPHENLCTIIKKICETFTVISNTREQILLNLNEILPDFEDGLQYQTAIYGCCDCIITRNKKDFPFSKIAIFTPAEFVSVFS